MKRNVVVVFWVCRSQCPESGSSGLGVATSKKYGPHHRRHSSVIRKLQSLPLALERGIEKYIDSELQS